MVTAIEAVQEGVHGAVQGPGGAAAGGSTATALQLLQEFLKVQSARAEVYSRFNQGFRELLDHGQEAVFARLMHEVTPAFNAASQQVIHIESHLKEPAVNRPDLAALLRGVQEQERQKLKLTLSWQALRAAHASGRFSWQDAADRPRVHGAAAAAGTSNAQQEHQQQQHLLSLLDQMQLETTGSAADGCDVRAAANDQHAMPATAVKPGFYEQQMQRAVADAVAASASQEAVQGSSSSNAAASHGHGCGSSATHGCQHSHSHEHDPLEPSPLEPTEAEFNAAVREALQELDACVVGINDLLDEVREAVQELQEAF